MSSQTLTVPWPAVAAAPPSTMRALVLTAFGEPEVLQIQELPTPEPAPDEVLVRVAAAGVGRLLDVVARSGRHPYAKLTPPHVLGGECAGTVAALGAEVVGLSVGDHVAVFQSIVTVEDDLVRRGLSDLSPGLEILGIHRRGSDAEYVAVPARNVTVVPAGIGPEDAAALAGVGPVATNQFARVGGIGPGSKVIVHAASSGLGSTTALLAHHLGATVIGTSRSEAKRETLRGLGLTHVLDGCAPDFVARAREILGGGADLVVDNLGDQQLWDGGFDALAPSGAIVSSGAFLGHTVQLNLQRLYSMGIRVVGVRTGTYASARALWDAAADGFRTALDRTFPLEEAAEAHRRVEAGGNVGRVLLAP